MKQYKIDGGKIITVVYNDIFPYIILDENKCILKLKQNTNLIPI